MIDLWADVPSDAFNTIDPHTIAVLPLGATEQHGPHLPLSVDTALVDAVLDRVVTDAPALRLPTLAITKSDEHGSAPGTLSLRAETLLAVLRDIADGVAKAGVRRLVYFNGHGGNTALLEVAVRAARIDHGLITAQTNWFAFADLSGFDADALRYDLHAGDIETSAMRAAHPNRVDMSRAQDFRTAMHHWEAAGHQTGLTGQPARPGWVISDLNADGAAGNARAATAEKGAQLLDSAAAGFSRWLEDFVTFNTAAAP